MSSADSNSHNTEHDVSPTDWMTPSQVARVVGVTPDRIRALADAGRIPYTWTPLGRMFMPSDVDRLMEERKAQAEREAARLKAKENQ